jgi:LysM repeat protein
MRPALWTTPACALALALCSCATHNDPTVSTGPFDKNGNYVEEWADNPAKWRKSGGRIPSPHEVGSDEIPMIARNEQPPDNSVPLVSGGTQTVLAQRTPPRQTRTTETTRTVVAQSKPKPRPATVQAKAKPKSKPKAVVKAKPKVQRYTVKKGDSLSRIASRNGTSVSALRRANGISGDVNRPGQSLALPR